MRGERGCPPLLVMACTVLQVDHAHASQTAPAGQAGQHTRLPRSTTLTTMRSRTQAHCSPTTTQAAVVLQACTRHTGARQRKAATHQRGVGPVSLQRSPPQILQARRRQDTTPTETPLAELMGAKSIQSRDALNTRVGGATLVLQQP